MTGIECCYPSRLESDPLKNVEDRHCRFEPRQVCVTLPVSP